MSTYYTSKYSGEQIDEAVKKIMDGEMTGDYADRQLSNLDTPQGALANLGAGVRPNLLINPFFEVNQRGQTSYTGIVPAFDMWRLNSTTMTVTAQDEGISISGQGFDYLKEYLENPERFNGKTLTVSALVKNPNGQFRLNLYNETKNAQNVGNIPASSDWTLVTKTVDNFSVADGDKVAVLLYPDGSVSGQTATAQVAATKLEEGDTQTLAYQAEDGTWQLLPQPESDYATQLLRCQRYFFRSTANHYFSGCMYDASNGIFLVPYSVEMRTVPAVTVKNSGTLRFYDNTAAVLTAGNISVKSADGSGIKLLVSGVSGGKAGSATITDMQFDFSAEL